MGLREFFDRKPVFTRHELAAYLDKSHSRRPGTRSQVLAYHLRNGNLVRVRNGLYAAVPPGGSPGTFPVDPYLLAGKMADDAVLAFHTALEVQGKAHSVFERFFYLTGGSPRPVHFRSYRFHSVRFPKPLRDKGEEVFGVKTMDRSGVDIRVTSLERALVDLLDRPDLGGGWEEIWRSLESVEYFDLQEVIDYALLLENATTAAKVGFFLSQHRERLMVGDADLERLREHRPRQPHYMDKGGRGTGTLVREWNLVVPTRLLDHSLEEVG